MFEYNRNSIKIHTYVWLYIKEKRTIEERIKIKKSKQSIKKINFVV